jgi:type IV pilus assembly protein PilN
MKFKINLASRPYEDARRFALRWGAIVVVAALFTAALVYGAVAAWRHAHVINQQMAVEKSNLDRLNQQELHDIAILNKSENRDVRDKAQVLNSLIRRKEFSWTLIFADLEHLMPTRLHVISITPQLDLNNDIEIHMKVGGDSREKAIELVQNMEKSREFRRAQVVAETSLHREGGVATNNPDTVQLEITAQYVPVPHTAPAAQEQEGSEQ